MCSNNSNRNWGPFLAVESASIRPHACASHPSVVVIQHGLINISNINSKFDVDVDVDVR